LHAQALPQSPRKHWGGSKSYGSFDPSGEGVLLLEATAVGPISPDGVRTPSKARRWDTDLMA
jgi:hypothetical protein